MTEVDLTGEATDPSPSNNSGIDEVKGCVGHHSPESPRSDGAVSKTNSEDSKDDRLTVRSNSSPALLELSESKPNGDQGRGKYEGCNTLSDVTQVLFSSNDQPLSLDDKGEEASRSSEGGQMLAKTDTKSDITMEPDVHEDKPRSSTTEQPVKHDDESKGASKALGSVSNKKPEKTPIVPRKHEKRIDTNQRSSRRPTHTPHRQRTEGSSSKDFRASGQKLEAKTPQRRTTVGSSARKGRDKDLLSKFITYNDQRPPVPPRMPSTPHAQQLSHRTPASKRQLGSMTKQREGTPDVMRKDRQADDGVQLCSITDGKDKESRPDLTPESQRKMSLLKSPRVSKAGTSLTSSSSFIEDFVGDHHFSRSDMQRVVFDILRITVIMFCIGSMIARGVVAFGGKMSLFHYVAKSPVIWTVRWYMAALYVALVVVEIDVVGIPLLLPRESLDNWMQKGYIISFIGLLDLSMNSNKSLADIADEVQGGTLTERGIRMRCAFAVTGISSRGMIACGLIYMLLGLIGHSGETRRRLWNRSRTIHRSVGLAKTPPTRKRASA